MKFLLSILSFLLFTSPLFAQEKPYDYVIKDARIFDGESLRPAQRDLAILGDRIVRVGEISREEAKEAVEAEGLILAPGFIDLHTHSDFNPFIYASLGNKALQGVTTEVVGNCGMSAAPVTGRHGGEIKQVWQREGVDIPQPVAWESFSEYREEAEFQGLDSNFVGLVGHGNLRSAVMGMENRPASPEEIEAMKELLRRSLEEGAFGISFGLAYLPGISAAQEELVELCREAGHRNGLCAFHIRSESKGLVEAIQEALEVGRRAGARIHISHLKASGKKNWPKIHQVFRLIEEARAAGLRVTADAYPYTAGFAELGVILPDEIYQDPNRLNRLKDPAQREELLQALNDYYQKNPVSWNGIRIATVSVGKNRTLSGKSLLEISKEQNRNPVETLIDLLAEEEFHVSAFYFSQDPSVVDQVISKPYVGIGSDSIADGSSAPHPRAYGTFPRRLARCAKETGEAQTLCWGTAIQQMTAFPARVLGLTDRGKIGAGLSADLVLFDPKVVRDRADYGDPRTLPEGILWVFVNGKPAVRKGRYAPARSGLFLAGEK